MRARAHEGLGCRLHSLTDRTVIAKECLSGHRLSTPGLAIIHTAVRGFTPPASYLILWEQANYERMSTFLHIFNRFLIPLGGS